MVHHTGKKQRAAFAAAVFVFCMSIGREDLPVLQAEEMISAEQQEAGTYTVPEGWSEDTSVISEAGKTYRRSENLGLEDSSSILCSYMDTNYTVLEYEQLRDMLTNDIVYSRVDAQISSSAAYTDNKDYLYVLTADDASLAYREIFYYVVGDLKCFCVSVKEYRSEADDARAVQQPTPEEVGKQIAAAFVWNDVG